MINNNSGELRLEFGFTMETYVFEDVLQLGQGSNEPPSLSIY